MSSPIRVKVLVVDSDSKMRDLIRANLSTDSFEIYEAETAWDCIKAACRELPDLIIMDLHLPDHDGWEALSLLKLHGGRYQAEIIVTSPEPPSPLTLRKLQATDYVRKPFDVRYLLQRVERAVAGRRSRADLIFQKQMRSSF